MKAIARSNSQVAQPLKPMRGTKQVIVTLARTTRTHRYWSKSTTRASWTSFPLRTIPNHLSNDQSTLCSAPAPVFHRRNLPQELQLRSVQSLRRRPFLNGTMAPQLRGNNLKTVAVSTSKASRESEQGSTAGIAQPTVERSHPMTVCIKLHLSSNKALPIGESNKFKTLKMLKKELIVVWKPPSRPNTVAIWQAPLLDPSTIART